MGQRVNPIYSEHAKLNARLKTIHQTNKYM